MSSRPRPPVPVIVADHGGYSAYRDRHGRSFLPACRYDVSLVTDLAAAGEARGRDLVRVVGVAWDEQAIGDAVRSLAAGQPASRLVTLAERLLLPAAQLRDELGIPGQRVRQALLFRDKILMKRHLRARGIAVPDFAPYTPAAARRLLHAHLALVIKPRQGSGAQDITFIRSAADLDEFDVTHPPANLPRFEVEECITGPLYHVDSVVRGGGSVVAAVAGRYLDDPTAYLRLAPCRDVAVPPGPVLDELLAFNARVIACYPGYTGVTHHEIFLTAAGACLCEIAARPGGGGIAAGFWSRTGLNLRKIAVETQLTGSVPSRIDVAPHLTGWVVIYAGPGALLEPIEVPSEPWVIEAQVRAGPGARLTGPASCGDGVATISVAGDSEADVAQRLAAVIETAAPKVAAAHPQHGAGGRCLTSRRL
jgi:hypothetical protein